MKKELSVIDALRWLDNNRGESLCFESLDGQDVHRVRMDDGGDIYFIEGDEPINSCWEDFLCGPRWIETPDPKPVVELNKKTAAEEAGIENSCGCVFADINCCTAQGFVLIPIQLAIYFHDFVSGNYKALVTFAPNEPAIKQIKERLDQLQKAIADSPRYFEKKTPG